MMEEEQREQLLGLLRRRLSKKRYIHSLNVARRAVELAARHGPEAGSERAYFAGLVHDICKDMPVEEQLELIRAQGGEVPPEVLCCPQLFHAMAGGYYVKNELNVADQEILDAVRYHTTARAGMSPLEEIVYLADLTSAERNYPDAAYTRKLADTSIPQAMLYSLKYIITSLLESGAPVCRDTAEAYNAYVMLLRRRP